MTLQAIESRPEVSWEVLEKELSQDRVIQGIIADLKQGTTEHVGFTMGNNLLLYKSQIVLPRNSTLKAALLYEYHDSVMGGHSGELKTYL